MAVSGNGAMSGQAFLASKIQSCMGDMRNGKVLGEIQGGKLDRNGFIEFGHEMKHQPESPGLKPGATEQDQADFIHQQIKADGDHFTKTLDHYSHGPNPKPQVDKQEQDQLGHLYDLLNSGKLSRDQALALMRGGAQGGCS